MNFRRLKHTILRLSPEEKMVGLGTLLIVFGCFMPWYSIVLNFDKKNLTQTGFGGDLGVIGFIIFIMAIIALLILVGEHLHIRLPQFGYSKEQSLFFLMGQSAFLVLLTIAIYTKRSLDFTDAELRFGIYLALIGGFLGAFAAFAQLQKLKTKEVERFFDHDEAPAKRSRSRSSEVEEEISDNAEEAEEVPEEDQQFFIEEEETVVEMPAEEEVSEYSVTEDDLLEDIKEVPAEENSTDQSDYFTREAGLAEEGSEDQEDTPEEEEKKEDDDSDRKGPSMNFYED